jgi:AcrR family transcriptional regulator
MRSRIRFPAAHSVSPLQRFPIPDPDAFADRKQLVEAAIRLDAHRQPRSVAEICAEAGVDESVYDTYFDHADQILPAFYDLAVDQYRLLSAATEEYDDFTFEERLASFYYILLDTLGEHRAFVQSTFDTRIRYDSSFRGEVRTVLRELLSDERIPQSNRLVTGLWPVHEVLTTITFAVIRHWISDESENQAATTALVDKLVAFVAELVTFRGVSRGVDLAWHIVQNDALGLGRLPVVGRLMPGRGSRSPKGNA